jgi:HPr kinase/phosphorylase
VPPTPKNTPVTVGDFYQKHAAELELELVCGEAGLDRRIGEPTVNRPGLALSGFYSYFADKRIQVIGSAELSYLQSLTNREREDRLRRFFASRMPCLVLARRAKVSPLIERLSAHADIPVFRTPMITMNFINAATIALELVFAPRQSEHGSMVDIMGIGTLIRGASGIGKSECVLSLHMEVRGIGIINVAAIFGISSIRPEKTLDLVVTLKDWREMEDVDRHGLHRHEYKILGISVPHVIIPVRMGRDLGRLVEVAALDQKLKSLGTNSALEFNEKLIKMMETKD